jgi:hypothetical protein
VDRVLIPGETVRRLGRDESVVLKAAGFFVPRDCSLI